MKISLIGFMGSGKSSVAKVLADKLNFTFIEMDDLILKKSNKRSINDIFYLDGEEHFRDLETKVAKEISNFDRIVVSTGGGIVTKERNRKYLKKGKTIFLKTSFETLEKRLEGDDTRPLFKDRIKAKELFNLRKNIYEDWADHIILTDRKSIDQIIKNLLKYL